MINPRTYWDTFSGSYQMGAQKHRVYLLDLLERKGVKSFLDVGCGTGPLYEIIKDQNRKFQYKGTDYSPAMIEISQQSFPEGNWEVEDARRLSEGDNSWDAVVLLHSLDHLDDYKSAIAEAARVARKYIVIVLWRSLIDKGTNLNSINRMGKKDDEPPWEDTHLQDYSKEVLEEAFKEAGLVIDEIAEGETINEPGKFSYLYCLRKDA